MKGGKRELMNLYVKPFRELIAATKPLSAMNCYSSYDDEAVTGSKSLMTGLLRDSLGFRGTSTRLGFGQNALAFPPRGAPGGAAARMAIEAGIDLEAGSDEYRHAERMVREGFLDENTSTVPSATFYSLNLHLASSTKNRRTHSAGAGRYTRPRPCASPGRSPTKAPYCSKTATACCRCRPANCGRWPLSARNADRVQFGDYSWSADKDKGVTPLRGIREYLAGSGVRVNHAEGCDPYSQDKSGFGEALKAARRSDVVVVFVGSQSTILARASEPATSGEVTTSPACVCRACKKSSSEELARTGKPMIVVLVTGKPFELARIRKSADAVLVQWYAGEEAGTSVAGILFREDESFGQASRLVSAEHRTPAVLLQPSVHGQGLL